MNHPVPDDLTPEQKKALAFWVRDRYPELFDPRKLRVLVDQCLLHFQRKGNPRGYTDWLAVCKNWVVNDIKFTMEADQRRQRELPQEPRPTGFETEELVPIGNVLDLFKKRSG